MFWNKTLKMSINVFPAVKEQVPFGTVCTVEWPEYPGPAVGQPWQPAVYLITLVVPYGEVGVAGSLGSQAVVEVLTAARVILVHCTHCLDQLRRDRKSGEWAPKGKASGPSEIPNPDIYSGIFYLKKRISWNLPGKPACHYTTQDSVWVYCWTWVH